MSSFQGNKMNPTRFHKSQIKFFIILTLVSIFMGLPILFIFMQAFKPIDELFAYPPRFFVQRPTFDNFRKLLESMETSTVPISRYFFNSIISTLATVILTLLISTFAGYALSKKKFRAKRIIMEINTLALMFVSAAVMIPKYLIVYRVGMINSFWSHIIPALAMPVGLFLIKQFIDQIPDELIEAAQIDGAREIHIFRNIIIPMSKSAIATVIILSFQASWNTIDASSMYISDEKIKSFSFYLSTLTTAGNDVVGQSMAAAATLIMFVPNLVIFIIMQKQVMATMAHSGIK